MRSSTDMSPSKPGRMCVRRSSPYFATISPSSSETIDRWRSGGARIDWESALGGELVGCVDDLLALERGEATELQLEDRARLQLVDLEQRDQAVTGLLHRRGTAEGG